jgi:hypothetical protein
MAYLSQEHIFMSNKINNLENKHSNNNKLEHQTNMATSTSMCFLLGSPRGLELPLRSVVKL